MRRSALATSGKGGVVAALSSGSGSFDVLLTLAVLLSVPVADGAIVTVNVNVALAPLARFAAAHEMVPLAPTAGVVQVKPAGASSELKRSEAGSTSLSVTPAAAAGPALLIT